MPAAAVASGVKGSASSSHVSEPRPTRGVRGARRPPFVAVACTRCDAERASPPSQCWAGSNAPAVKGVPALSALPHSAMVTPPVYVPGDPGAHASASVASGSPVAARPVPAPIVTTVGLSVRALVTSAGTAADADTGPKTDATSTATAATSRRRRCPRRRRRCNASSRTLSPTRTLFPAPQLEARIFQDRSGACQGSSAGGCRPTVGTTTRGDY